MPVSLALKRQISARNDLDQSESGLTPIPNSLRKLRAQAEELVRRAQEYQSKAEQEMAAKQAELMAEVERTQHWRALFYRQEVLEKLADDLSVACEFIVREVLCCPEVLNTNSFAARIKRALRYALEPSVTAISVNPTDAATVEALLGAKELGAGVAQSCPVVSDSSVALGDARIETRVGTIEVNVHRHAKLLLAILNQQILEIQQILANPSASTSANSY